VSPRAGRCYIVCAKQGELCQLCSPKGAESTESISLFGRHVTGSYFPMPRETFPFYHRSARPGLVVGGQVWVVT
jgi:hypothetical protein